MPALLLALTACGGWTNAEEEQNYVGNDNPMFDIFEEDAQIPDVPMCGDMQLSPESVAPNLLLVVDKSGSMKDPISSATTQRKIDDTKSALNLLLDQGDGSINFGFLPYPGSDSCSSGSVRVDCAEDSVPAIQSRVNQLSPGGGTPTGPALQEALDYGPLHDSARSNFVVLLTDGKPTCPSGDGTDETEADTQATIDAAAALHANAIDTFVVGIGEDLNASNPDVLNETAVAGGRPRAGAVKYYQANSLAQLNAALSDISAAVFGCTFTLNPAPEDSAKLWVTFDGQMVTRDPSHSNGWDYNDGLNQVTAYGAACSALQSGAIGEVEIWMGCADPVEPDPPVEDPV
jgi:hypothetical protein